MPYRLIKPPWVLNAEKYLGEKEIKGRGTNPRLKEVFDFVDGKMDGVYPGGMDNDDDPWCAGFMSGILEMSGIVSTRSWWARSYMKWGRLVPGPVFGAIAVLERGPVYGHVTIVVGKTARDTRAPIWGLGGNQSDGVRISLFERDRVLGYRYPSGYPFPNFLLPLFDQAEEFSRNEA